MKCPGFLFEYNLADSSVVVFQIGHSLSVPHAHHATHESFLHTPALKLHTRDGVLHTTSNGTQAEPVDTF